MERTAFMNCLSSDIYWGFFKEQFSPRIGVCKAAVLCTIQPERRLRLFSAFPNGKHTISYIHILFYWNGKEMLFEERSGQSLSKKQ
jgi:hypothetical protein